MNPFGQINASSTCNLHLKQAMRHFALIVGEHLARSVRGLPCAPPAAPFRTA
jgi:hypothetical protein